MKVIICMKNVWILINHHQNKFMFLNIIILYLDKKNWYLFQFCILSYFLLLKKNLRFSYYWRVSESIIFTIKLRVISYKLIKINSKESEWLRKCLETKRKWSIELALFKELLMKEDNLCQLHKEEGGKQRPWWKLLEMPINSD